MDQDERARDRARQAADGRRAALAQILERRAEPILSGVVSDALRAAEFAGLGQTVAARYLTRAREALPTCVEALAAPDPARARLLDEHAHVVKDLVAVGVPPSVQRNLASLGFRVANGIARESARTHGFAPDELEDELRIFRREFEARFFAG